MPDMISGIFITLVILCFIALFYCFARFIQATDTYPHIGVVTISGDSTHCSWCDKTWDTNDIDPPSCTLTMVKY